MQSACNLSNYVMQCPVIAGTWAPECSAQQTHAGFCFQSWVQQRCCMQQLLRGSCCFRNATGGIAAAAVHRHRGLSHLVAASTQPKNPSGPQNLLDPVGGTAISIVNSNQILAKTRPHLLLESECAPRCPSSVAFQGMAHTWINELLGVQDRLQSALLTRVQVSSLRSSSSSGVEG